MKNKSFLTIVVVALLSLPAIIPLLSKGLFVTDDGEWMIIRFSAFHQALRDGEFPVRFLGRLNQEFGYPVANFLYPGFMYLAEPFRLLGFDFVESIKIVLILSMVLSAVFTYLWLRKFFDKFASSIGALFYLYTPYHLYDLYKRGSVGEIVALSLMPFILWQIERKSLVWSSIGIGLLLISHNTLSLLFLTVLVCYLLLDVYIAKKKHEAASLLSIVFGLGLSSFFWISALYELSLTVFSQTKISNWNEYFAPIDLIGYSTIAVVLLTIGLVVTKNLSFKKHRLTLLFFVVCLTSIFMAILLSAPLWNILPVGFVQFPFRFLSLVVLTISFVIASNLSCLEGKTKIIVGVVAVSILAISAFPFFKTGTQEIKDEGYYATNMATTTVHDEYMPVWVKEKPTQKSDQKVLIVKASGNVKTIVATNKEVSFNINGEERTTVEIQKIYWPGWDATIDGKLTEISYTNPKGLMTIVVPEGEHHVKFSFGETPLRLLSDIVSVLSFGSLIVLSLFNRKRKK